MRADAMQSELRFFLSFLLIAVLTTIATQATAAGPELAASKRSHCLGVQGNMWTEHTPTPTDVNRQVWPRLCALAEVGWTPKDLRNGPDFLARMETHVARLKTLGVKTHVSGKQVDKE